MTIKTALRYWQLSIIVGAIAALFNETLALMTGVGLWKQLDDAVVAWAFLGALVLVVVYRRLRWSWWVLLPLVGLVLAGVLSSWLRQVPFSLMVKGGWLMLKPFTFFVALSQFRWDRAMIKAMLLLFGIVMGFILLVGVADFVAPTTVRHIFPPTQIEYRGGLPSVKSVFSEPSLYGIFTSITVLFWFARYWVKRRWVYWVPLFASLAAGPFISFRRRAVIGVISSILLAYLAKLRHFRLNLTMLLFIVVTLIAGGVAFPVINAWIYRFQYDFIQYRDQTARYVLYETAGKIMLKRFPWGEGWGRYGGEVSRDVYSPTYSAYNIDRVKGLQPDNTSYITDTFWPWIAGETGLLGLVSYLGFMVSVGWVLWRRYARAAGQSTLVKTLLVWGLLVWSYTLIESVAQQIYGHFTGMYIFGLWAIILQFAHDQKQET